MPLASLVLDEFTSFASGVSAQAPLPAIRFTQAPNVAAARAEFAAQTPRVRVLFDNGAGAAGPGDIQSTYSADFSSWPPAGTVETLYFGRDGALQAAAPARQKSATFTLDPGRGRRPACRPAGTPGRPTPDGTGRRSLPPTASPSRPLRSRRPPPSSGPATLDLWVKSAAPVEDFQATITEVRPAAARRSTSPPGFLRSSNQVDSPTRPPCSPIPTYLGADATRPVAHRLHAGEDPDRPDRPHLPARDRAAGGDLRPGRRPAGLGVRHPGPAARAPRSASAAWPPRPWWSTWCPA